MKVFVFLCVALSLLDRDDTNLLVKLSESKCIAGIILLHCPSFERGRGGIWIWSTSGGLRHCEHLLSCRQVARCWFLKSRIRDLSIDLTSQEIMLICQCHFQNICASSIYLSSQGKGLIHTRQGFLFLSDYFAKKWIAFGHCPNWSVLPPQSCVHIFKM